MLKPYNLKNLDDFVKVSGKKLDIYFDFELTDFTARVYTDKSNKSHVFYSNYRGRTLTDDDRAKLRDYSGDLNEMVKLCKRNYMGDILDGGDTFTTVCDVVLIPEVKGLSFISYGYKIGRACAEKWFNNHDDSPIDYILVESAESISGETLQRVAKRYAFMDIKISSNLGYMLYNRQIAVKDKDGKVKRPAEDNVRRYGVGPGVSDLASLMRNFTDFIPIGFKWATYTPLCYVKDDFKEYLSNNTVFGMDWIEVPNKNMDGNSLPSGYRPEDSLTFYTTKRCIHRVLRSCSRVVI